MEKQYKIEARRPGGGMADAEDLKSSGDFSSCGFDSHPGYQFFSSGFNSLFLARIVDGFFLNSIYSGVR
jgi:hypothetical protein